MLQDLKDVIARHDWSERDTPPDGRGWHDDRGLAPPRSRKGAGHRDDADRGRGRA
jgi:hypothetical protein